MARIGSAWAENTRDVTSWASDTWATAEAVLSGVEIYPSATSALLRVVTDQSTGTLYWVITDSATPPSVAQIKAGQNHLGAAAIDAGSQAVSGLGTQDVSSSGLTEETSGYYAYFVHTTGSGDSNVAASDTFATGAAGEGGTVFGFSLRF